MSPAATIPRKAPTWSCCSRYWGWSSVALMPFGYGNGAYAATKAAVISVSESLEHELADDGIAVSVVCPSGVATGIFGGPDAIPPGLMAPAEAANRILAGVLAGRFYVFTHGDDDTRARIEGRTARIADDFDAAARDVV